ncbi:MAG: LptF/LptG family permease [Bacteroidia bacterium]
MKIIDLYIIKKFLGTFIFTIILICLVAVIFDISEKIDDFIEKKAPFNEIVFDYYLNFIPYFANLFSPLFVFIAVIYFTSRMAANTEIIAILNSGISFRRLLLPYFISAFIIAAGTYYLAGYVIPRANVVRLNFENIYIKNPFVYKARNIHQQVKQGEFVYFESFNNFDNIGYLFSYEKYDGDELYYKLLSDRIRWDSTANQWIVENYFIRHIDGMNERIETGIQMEGDYNFTPDEFSRRMNYIEAMDNDQLSDYIEQEQLRGSANLVYFQVEKHKRQSTPFAAFVLTLIGVALSSRKVRGGIGKQLGIGIGISFTFILFQQISTTFATNGSLPPIIAVWIPNIVVTVLGLYLLRIAPK